MLEIAFRSAEENVKEVAHSQLVWGQVETNDDRSTGEERFHRFFFCPAFKTNGLTFSADSGPGGRNGFIDWQRRGITGTLLNLAGCCAGQRRRRREITKWENNRRAGWIPREIRRRSIYSAAGPGPCFCLWQLLQRINKLSGRVIGSWEMPSRSPFSPTSASNPHIRMSDTRDSC